MGQSNSLQNSKLMQAPTKQSCHSTFTILRHQLLLACALRRLYSSGGRLLVAKCLACRHLFIVNENHFKTSECWKTFIISYPARLPSAASMCWPSSIQSLGRRAQEINFLHHFKALASHRGNTYSLVWRGKLFALVSLHCISIALCKKTRPKSQQMDIISTVSPFDELTEWCTPILGVLKLTRNARICADLLNSTECSLNKHRAAQWRPLGHARVQSIFSFILSDLIFLKFAHQ